MSNSAVAITCGGVSKRFALVDGGSAWRLAFGLSSNIPMFEALSDISFDVPKGQFIGILGRNGAGKSTLLRVLGGVFAADKGQVKVNGALSGLYELGLVGNPMLTGRQYAERLLTVHGFSRRERGGMIEEIQDFSELGDRFDDPVQTYSSGMGARLFFATATAGSYEVYLLDEVLSVGDQHFQSKCWRRLRDRVSRGASGVLVTHDWAAIVRLCERAHVLEDGRVTFSGPPEKAARLYLYGKEARTNYTEGIARFRARPNYPEQIAAGTDFKIDIEVEVLRAASVGIVCAIERLQPGFGWETVVLSRSAHPVGETPGCYKVTIDVPSLPLESGGYQIALHLVMADPEVPNRRIVLDGFGWLDGTGLPLAVDGAPQGLTLPVTWSLE